MSMAPDVDAYPIITIATKAINDTLVSESFVPCALVPGISHI